MVRTRRTSQAANGVACVRAKTAGCLTDALTMNTLSESSPRFLPVFKYWGGFMKRLPALLFFCSVTLLASAQDVGSWLTSLPQAKDYVQKRASSYDRSGANADFRTVAPGETLTLLDEAGPGLVSHVWVTIASDDPDHLK